MTAPPTAVACLEAAIAECTKAWRQQFKRPPNAPELVHAFTIVLGASPDDFVIDAAAVEARTSPARPPMSLRGVTSRVEYTARAPDWQGLDHIAISLGAAGGHRGEIDCVLGEVDGVLCADYRVHVPIETPPTAEDTCAFLLRRAVPPWRAAHPDRQPTRVVFRAIEDVADPIEYSLHGGDDDA